MGSSEFAQTKGEPSPAGQPSTSHPQVEEVVGFKVAVAVIAVVVVTGLAVDVVGGAVVGFAVVAMVGVVVLLMSQTSSAQHRTGNNCESGMHGGVPVSKSPSP